MQISAEIRWFWGDSDPTPASLEAWFLESGVHGCQSELGIKRRGNKRGVEVKGLITNSLSHLTDAPFNGPIELWTKWTSEPLSELLNSAEALLLLTKKQRWLRKFDTAGEDPLEIPLDDEEQPRPDHEGKRVELPLLGCNVELTRISVPSGDVWWTFGFESFGTLETVERSLRAAVHALASRQPPWPSGGLLAGYPEWILVADRGNTNR
jgi:hypothetical protein